MSRTAGDVSASSDMISRRTGSVLTWAVKRAHRTGWAALSAPAPSASPSRDHPPLLLRPSSTAEGFLAFWTRGNRMVAAAGLDEAKRLRAAKALIERRIPVDTAALSDPALDLRSLAHG